MSRWSRRGSIIAGRSTSAAARRWSAPKRRRSSFSPDGLFDIQVTTGTTNGVGVTTSGTITGAASTGATDIHRAYLVAVPKNTALTMLIASGSNLGFNVAGAANVVGNTVVLSAGHDISGGSIGGVSAGTIVPGTVANLQVNDGTYTSAVNAEATGYARLSAFSAMKFFSNVNVHADGEMWFSTQAAGGRDRRRRQPQPVDPTIWIQRPVDDDVGDRLLQRQWRRQHQCRRPDHAQHQCVRRLERHGGYAGRQRHGGRISRSSQYRVDHAQRADRDRQCLCAAARSRRASMAARANGGDIYRADR